MARVSSITVHDVKEVHVSTHEGVRSGAEFLTVEVGPVAFFFDSSDDVLDFASAILDALAELDLAKEDDL